MPHLTLRSVDMVSFLVPNAAMEILCRLSAGPSFFLPVHRGIDNCLAYRCTRPNIKSLRFLVSASAQEQTETLGSVRASITRRERSEPQMI
jgi:hypothetical protein